MYVVYIMYVHNRYEMLSVPMYVHNRYEMLSVPMYVHNRYEMPSVLRRPSLRLISRTSTWPSWKGNRQTSKRPGAFWKESLGTKLRGTARRRSRNEEFTGGEWYGSLVVSGMSRLCRTRWGGAEVSGRCRGDVGEMLQYVQFLGMQAVWALVHWSHLISLRDGLTMVSW